MFNLPGDGNAGVMLSHCELVLGDLRNMAVLYILLANCKYKCFIIA